MAPSHERSVLSALFVDFDNIYLCLLNQIDGKAAKIFATDPRKWFAWLTEYLEQVTELRRRIAVRRCYMNPKSFGDYRQPYLQCGFEVIDCPVLTRSGKTSADIRIAIDMLELVDFRSYYEEVILLSADADFTPVMLRLRKHDRRTIVLAVGGSSPTYRACFDTVIDQDDFVAEALASVDLREQHPPLPRKVLPVIRSDVSASELTTDLSPSEQEAIAQTILDYVRAASAPVTMASVANIARQANSKLESNWGGYGSFKQFFAQLKLSDLEVSSVKPSYVYDPTLHSPPSETDGVERAQEFTQRYPDLAEIAKKVCSVSDIPYLMPDHYQFIFSCIAEEINSNGYNMTQVSKVVRDRCQEANFPVSRKHVNFVLQGIAFAGHRFGENREDRDQLANLYLKNTLNLCERSMVEFTQDEKALIETWFRIPAEGIMSESAPAHHAASIVLPSGDA